jgi:hypothetical protein
MATGQFIPPFPADIDRNEFGHWLSGFSDGEATFMVSIKGKGATGFNVLLTFAIMLRDDDTPILQQIQSFLGCGRLRWYGKCGRKIANAKPICAYRVTNLDELERSVVPHFARYPLRAKKAADFRIWSECVRFAASIKRRKWSMRPGKGCAKGQAPGAFPKWSDDEKDHFRSLWAALRQQRVYVGQPATTTDQTSGAG